MSRKYSIFIKTPNDVLCSNFMKLNLAHEKSVKSCVAYLTKRTKFRLALQLYRYCANRAQNLPGPARDNILRRRRTGSVVNIVKTRGKVNPIFGEIVRCLPDKKN